MNRGAIIDIGSNSVRLIIYHINEHSNFEVIDEAKETIRLGSYLTKNNYLIDDGIEIAINVLKRFKEICQRYEVVEIYVVATEAVRKAVNRSYICNRIESELGLNVNILLSSISSPLKPTISDIPLTFLLPSESLSIFTTILIAL